MTLRKFIRAAAFAAALLITLPNALADTVHIATKGETLFGIANKYGISVAQLLEWNPQAERGIKKGMRLVIKDGKVSTENPSESVPNREKEKKTDKEEINKETQSSVKETTPVVVRQEVSEKENTSSKIYISKKGDNFRKISKKTGIAEDKLIDFNPFVDPDKIPGGTSIRLTEDAPYFDIDSPSTDNPYPEENPAVINDENQDQEEVVTMVSDDYPRDIMIALPFMASAESQPRQSQYYADFYRGFLIAAKNLTNSDGNKVEIIALDTQNNPSLLSDQLDFNSHRNFAVVIAPEDEKQLQETIEFTKGKNMYVINAFNFKNEAFRTNQHVIQANIDQSQMYKKAIDGLMTNYPEHIPVILNAIGAKAEKANFTDALVAKYREKGIEPLEISFEGSLPEEKLKELDPFNSYVIIPKSGALGLFNSIAPAIQSMQREPGGEDHYLLFGYPDWTAFRGESLDMLHALNALIYSRFYINEQDSATINVLEQFDEWYGQRPIEAVPNQGILGFDLGTFIISALQEGPLENALNSTKFKGVQSSFEFKNDEENGMGHLNTSLYLIRYNPNHTCSVTIL